MGLDQTPGIGVSSFKGIRTLLKNKYESFRTKYVRLWTKLEIVRKVFNQST